jgi:hypothetical protein
VVQQAHPVGLGVADPDGDLVAVGFGHDGSGLLPPPLDRGCPIPTRQSRNQIG